MSTVVALPTDTTALTVGRSAELFLESLANPNTIRGYATAVGKTAEHLGEHRPLAVVADDEVGDALETSWGRAAVGSWLSWCRDREREAGGCRVGQAPGDPGFGDTGALPAGDRPPGGAPRGRDPGEDALPDAVRNRRPR